jgi:hypothetical protein
LLSERRGDILQLTPGGREWDIDVHFEENAHCGASAIGTFVSSESKVRGDIIA